MLALKAFLNTRRNLMCQLKSRKLVLAVVQMTSPTEKGTSPRLSDETIFPSFFIVHLDSLPTQPFVPLDAQGYTFP